MRRSPHGVRRGKGFNAWNQSARGANTGCWSRRHELFVYVSVQALAMKKYVIYVAPVRAG